jgi:hypothetical protein
VALVAAISAGDLQESLDISLQLSSVKTEQSNNSNHNNPARHVYGKSMLQMSLCVQGP